jgi:hypothetical protein
MHCASVPTKNHNFSEKIIPPEKYGGGVLTNLCKRYFFVRFLGEIFTGSHILWALAYIMPEAHY